MAKTVKTFEKNIEALEEIITKLERGEAPLADCINMYEKGVTLAKECSQMLDDAEQKVILISEANESEHK